MQSPNQPSPNRPSPKGGPSRRETVLVLAAVLLLGGAFAVGCGDNTTGPVYPRDEVIVDVRDGLWELVSNNSVVGCDSTEAEEDTIEVSLCSLNFTAVTTNPQLVRGVECESFVDDGTDFTFACNIGIYLEPCLVDVRVEGSGTRDSSSLSYTVRSWTSGITGPVNPCGIYDNPCTSVVAVTGTFLTDSLNVPCLPGEIPDASSVALLSVLGAR